MVFGDMTNIKLHAFTSLLRIITIMLPDGWSSMVQTATSAVMMNHLAHTVIRISPRLQCFHRDAPLDLFDKLKTPENLNSDTNSPLYVAARYGHTNIAQHLIELGANVNGMCRGTLPLHIAVEKGHTELALSLIKHGASIDQRDADQKLPLHVAVEHDHTELTRSLIEHGASLDIENRFGNTPLCLAMKHCHSEVALLLIQHGALVNQQGSSGNIPLHIAAANGHAEIAFSLLDHGASVNQEDRVGNLPLYLAVENGHNELALSLIKYGASINPGDLSKRLTLHHAAKHGHAELVLSLIKHGASVNQRDLRSDLPLNLAVKHGHTDVALLLIKHGASVSQSDRHGYLPFTCYVKKVNEDAKRYNDGLFTKLIPDSKMDILKLICQIISQNDFAKEQGLKLEVLSSELHKLIQHFILVEEIYITISAIIGNFCFEMKLNGYVITSFASMKTIYLCSVLVILLGCKVSFVGTMETSASSVGTSATPAGYVEQEHAIDDLWNAYKEKKGVRKLQAICVQITRQSMNSLTDDSFQSLPVPLHLQKMLMFQDIADVLFEGYQMWPKCISIEELI